MPNTFITLDVPTAANGVGAPTVIAATGHPKTLVLTGPVTGRYVVEGSNDGGQTWDILVDDNDGTQALFTSQNAGAKSVDCIIEQVRVRSVRALATAEPPTLTMGAPPAVGPNLFAKLDVPTGPGFGAVLDLGVTAGPLKTFILRGAVPERSRFTILASMDGVRFDEALLFTSDQQGARSVRVMCRYLRVQRAGAPGPAPALAVGAEPTLEIAGGHSGPFISFGDESAKTTTSAAEEEVLQEFVLPATMVAGAVMVSMAALARKTAPDGEATTLRLRLGGQPGTPDGAVAVTAEASSTVDTPLSARSAPLAAPGSTLVKVTGQGNGVARPVLRGLVVYLEPALTALVIR